MIAPSNFSEFHQTFVSVSCPKCENHRMDFRGSCLGAKIFGNLFKV